MPGTRRAPFADRVPAGKPCHMRLALHHAEAIDSDRLDAARKPLVTQGDARARAAREGMAAARAAEAQDGDPCDVRARRSGESARADGVVTAYRQDHARRRSRLTVARKSVRRAAA